MKNVITRNLISNNFIATTLVENFFDKSLTKTKKFSKSKLVSKINLWKYVLTHRCNAIAGESILIGFCNIDIDYLAVCFAAAELSLKIVIVDYSRADEFKDIDFFDPKTKLLSPIDIFLYDVPNQFLSLNETKRHNFFANCSNRSYSIVNDIDYTVNRQHYRQARKILPNPTDIVMRCTSSGTTGTPKIIEHTHEFLYKISIRNVKKFLGKCVHIANLNHGSSLAVYLLPALASNNVTEHLLYSYSPLEDFVDGLVAYKDTLEFVMFPYPYMIENFINSSNTRNIKWPNLNVQTLSYIQDTAKDAIKNNTFKSITSIFGSNETSGPVFEAIIDKSNTDQESNVFIKGDNFYQITFYENNLIGITLPVYNTEIITNDVFEQVNEKYIHRGRTDLIKINGEIVDIKLVNSINAKYENFYLVTDAVKNCLYLACWHTIDESSTITAEVNNMFKRLTVNKIAVLNKQSFFSGIKLDNELLREYFRNHV